MSQENVEVVRRAYEAWQADDLEAFLAELHPDVEWHGAIESEVEGRASAYRGHEGARRGWAEYRGEAFGRLDARTEDIRDLGESVLVLGRFAVSGRSTHIELDTELGQIITFRDGKIATANDYLSHREALEAAGLPR